MEGVGSKIDVVERCKYKLDGAVQKKVQGQQVPFGWIMQGAAQKIDVR